MGQRFWILWINILLQSETSECADILSPASEASEAGGRKKWVLPSSNSVFAVIFSIFVLWPFFLRIPDLITTLNWSVLQLNFISLQDMVL